MPPTITQTPSCDLDPFGEAFRADPYSQYRRLRALGPVVRLERYGIWCVHHHAVVREVLSDWRRFGNAGGGGLWNLHTGAAWRPRSIILEVDPPEHQRTRQVLSRVFSAQRLKALRPQFDAAARRLFADALARGTGEAVTELVQPFPLTVFPAAIGLRDVDPAMMLAYGAMVFGGFGPPTEWYETIMAQADRVSAWIEGRCGREALAPDGLGAQIYDAADGGAITAGEAGQLVRSLLSAGVDTTIDSIGLALRCLVDHPEQWAALKADPARAGNAFEEATRYDSSSQSLFRTARQATELCGVRIGAHEKILVLIGSAGRDPAFWQEADRFDIRRRCGGQIGYGTGIHGCVAQMMARLEGEAFLRAAAEMVDTLAPAGPAVLRLHPGLRGLARLPLHLTARTG